MKIADPLIFMVYPWVNFKSSDNGQGIEYLLKKVRISGKFNVSLMPCVMPCLKVRGSGWVAYTILFLAQIPLRPALGQRVLGQGLTITHVQCQSR